MKRPLHPTLWLLVLTGLSIATATSSISGPGSPEIIIRRQKNFRQNSGRIAPASTLRRPTDETITAIQQHQHQRQRITQQQQQPQETIINFVFSGASLLSGSDLMDIGKMDGCLNATDPSCRTGVAAVHAFAKKYSRDHPTLILPLFEKNSQFVQVHPLGWSVNRVVLKGIMGWNCFLSTPSLLLQDKRDNQLSKRDLTFLHDRSFPFVLSNVIIPPSNTWNSAGRHRLIYFDQDTHIALIAIADNSQQLNYDQAEAALGLLDAIEEENAKVGSHCRHTQSIDTEREALYDYYEKEIFSSGETSDSNANSNPGEAGGTNSTINGACWIPVIVYYDEDPSQFDDFLDAMITAPYPPALILDAGENNPKYDVPTKVPSTATPGRDLWVHSYWLSPQKYLQHQITMNTTDTPPSVQNVSLISEWLSDLDADLKDDTYSDHIDLLRELALEAMAQDPVLAQSTAMPPQLNASVHRCNSGECEAGNLFASAMQWKMDSDIAFLASGGLRGNGWPAGPVKTSDVWAMMPYPNTLCSGVMSGLSLFRLLDYSISTATFEGRLDDQADRLLQVAGLKVHYNSQLPLGEPRMLSVDVWRSRTKSWQALYPAEMYTFATDSFLCGSYDPFPMLLGADGSFTLPGEVGGDIGEFLEQDVVADYMNSLAAPYNTSLEGRLVDDRTAAKDVMNFVQTLEDCGDNQYFGEALQHCFDCPAASELSFTRDQLEFRHQIGREADLDMLASLILLDNNASSAPADDSAETLVHNIHLVNGETRNFTIVLKQLPTWLEVRSVDNPKESLVEGRNYVIPAGHKMGFQLRVIVEEAREQGTSRGSVAVGQVSELTDNDDPGLRFCAAFGKDLTFDVALTVIPPEDLNNLGAIRIAGVSLMSVSCLTAIGLAIWVQFNTKKRIVQKLQPPFLQFICLGILIMALTILPMSFDDGIVSQDTCDSMCVTVPWLLTSGLTIVLCALFTKLWRINKLFHAQRFERMKVSERDVIIPFLVLFTLNLILLTAWTVVDPLQWNRLPVQGQEWKTYGSCRSDGTGYIFLGLILCVDLLALIAACYQAYLARNISLEYSEAKNLGLALFTWFQVLLLGLPSLFLVSPENFTARYFLKVGLIFVLTISMLLVIFVPLIFSLREYNHQARLSETATGGRRGSIAVTGMDTITSIPEGDEQTANNTDDLTSHYSYPTSHPAG